MKLALFTSLILHVVALTAFPLGSREVPQAPEIFVSLLPLAFETEPTRVDAPVPKEVAAQKNTFARLGNAPAPPEPAPALGSETPSAPTPAAPVALVAHFESNGDGNLAVVATEPRNTSYQAGGATGNGNAASSLPPGRGSGLGGGSGRGVVTSVRYRDTPQPRYPDSARREGKEGRVLLRVLVDEEGKTKSVEVNASSGSDALDQAAAAAIKRWRFIPAQVGDQAIESWVKVPIEFQLSNAKP